MRKLLFLAALFLGVALNTVTANAQRLTIDQSLEAVCRVNTNSGRGSGTVFAEDEDKYYILTNGHVVGRSSRGTVEFFQDGYKSANIPFKTEYTAYKDGTALDLSVLSVKKKYFGRYPPRVIPLAPRGTEIKANDLVMAGGCPSAQWACAWKGRVIKNSGAVISFNAAPIGGQSGSGVLVVINDEKGEEQTRLGILLAWRVGDGAWTDDGPTDYGAGLSLKQIYEILDGNGREHPIETSYNIISDVPKQTKPERLNKVCPHCGKKIQDHVVIPKDGGLRRTVKGEFMFCPELKFEDGGIADTAKYYNGIRVGELYEGNGLFPWCPRPPNRPRPPQPEPQPPNGGGDGFNPWPGRPDPGNGGPKTHPSNDFEKERQEYLDKITELQEKLTNLEGLSESLKAELSGTTGNLHKSQDEVNGLRDLLGRVEGQKTNLEIKISQLINLVEEKDSLLDNSGHYLDDATGGNGNAVENVSFTLGGASLGMLALKYGVPFLLRRRRKRKKEDDENGDDGYDIDREAAPSDDGCDDCVQKHVHEHQHYGIPDCGPVRPQDHSEEYVMDRRDLPKGRGVDEIPNEFLPYGFKADPVSSPGLKPQLPHVPFGSRKSIGPEQIMTALGELVNEYGDDHTMTAFQIDTLLRQRLKKKYNIE